MLDREAMRRIAEAEQQALLALDDDTVAETTFVCPLCGGVANLALDAWLGHTSSCQNGCF
ncbi:MAG: hypothetical protein K6T78_03065 [Alicyclobacillus sp.]|nr:hypothetical protein [Alicyclobacillus sp.]